LLYAIRDVRVAAVQDLGEDRGDSLTCLFDIKIARLKRCTPHKLRHRFATGALNDGAPLHVVSDQLGHADVRTTSTNLHAVPGQPRKVYEG
jgi:integrase